jgi:GTPase
MLKMKSVRKIPYFVKTLPDVVTAIKGLSNEKFTPVFQVSNVKGDGIQLLCQFLNLVPPRVQWGDCTNGPTEVIVDESYFVAGVGTVIGGTVLSGRVKSGETVLLGPDGNGEFIPVLVRSIHNKRQPVKEVLAGKSAGFALKKVKRSAIRKGMVLVSPSVRDLMFRQLSSPLIFVFQAKPKASLYFTARIIVLYHSTTIQVNEILIFHFDFFSFQFLVFSVFWFLQFLISVFIFLKISLNLFSLFSFLFSLSN